jgi:hypothetical protein
MFLPQTPIAFVLEVDIFMSYFLASLIYYNPKIYRENGERFLNLFRNKELLVKP